MSRGVAPSRPGLREPVTFDDIVGQQGAVEGLRQRVRSGHRTTGVILSGPMGVGKRTLARLYAKAVLCEGPTDRGHSCDTCSACLTFNRGASADHILLDMKQGDAEKRTEYLLQSAKFAPWGKRRAITLVNADATPSPAFDRLLPTLEKAGTPTNFILLASDLKNVRLAGVSRCEPYRLRPLAPGVARELLATRLAELGTVPGEQALDLLAAAGQGLPKRLDHICARAAGLADLSLVAVRQALGFDWVDDVAARWCALLAGGAPAADVFAPTMNVAPGEQVRRTQVFLRHVYLHGLRGVPVNPATTDPAFLHRDEALLGQAAQALKRNADALGLEVEELWCALTRGFLAGDLVELNEVFPS